WPRTVPAGASALLGMASAAKNSARFPRILRRGTWIAGIWAARYRKNVPNFGIGTAAEAFRAGAEAPESRAVDAKRARCWHGLDCARRSRVCDGGLRGVKVERELFRNARLRTRACRVGRRDDRTTFCVARKRMDLRRKRRSSLAATRNL